MDSRGFLIFRMLFEFALGVGLFVVAVRVHISSHIWLDVVSRLILTILAIPILGDASTVRKDLYA
jgi:hypothetical protein